MTIKILSLATLVSLELKSGNFDNLAICPHRIEADKFCPMIYYKPTSEWVRYSIEDNMIKELPRKSCPAHHALELQRRGRYSVMKNYLERRK